MLNPILYQNADESVTVIDIPGSIAAAQGTRDCPALDSLLSCEPLQQPYPITNEPKSTKGKEHAQDNTVRGDAHQLYCTILENALQEIRKNLFSHWCLPRKAMSSANTHHPEGTVPDMQPGFSAQTSIEAVTPTGPAPDSQISDLDRLLPSLCGTSASYGLAFPTYLKGTDFLHRGSGVIGGDSLYQGSGSDWEPWDCVFRNTKEIPLALSVRRFVETSVDPPVSRFRIPPLSTFVLSDCARPAIFHDTLRGATKETGALTRFEFILLDPPWPNSSARRRGAYVTQPSLKQMEKMILGMKLTEMLANDGLVGIWITNKPAVRSLMLGSGGLLEQLNLRLEEEWIWLKITSKGEPVTPLDSTWRKPYEVLLLARSAVLSPDPSKPVPALKRRVVVGVPDLHSRKPCVKELVEPLLSRGASYAALEIFARHLVSGWWSWGNEVLQFNQEESWVRARTSLSAI